MAGTVLVRVISDSSKAVKGLNDAADATRGVGEAAEAAGGKLTRISEGADTLGGNTAKLAGGLGDVGGALEAAGFEKAGQALAGLQPLIMGVTGAMDILSLATNAQNIAWVKNAAVLVAQKVATAASTAVQWLLNAAMLANPIGLIIIAIVALVAVFVLLWTKSETFRDILIGTWEAIKGAAMAVFNFLKDFLGAIWDGILAAITFVWDFLKAYFTTMFNIYKTIFMTVFNAIKSVVETVFNAIKSVVETVLNFVKGIIENVVNNIRIIWAGISILWEKAKEVVDKVVGFFGGLWDSISGFFTAIPGKLRQIGADIINGLIDGIKAGIEKVKSLLSSVTNLIPDWKGPPAKDKKLLRGSGQMIMDGLNTGLEDGIPDIEKTLGNVTDTIEGFSAAPTVGMSADFDSGAGTAGLAPVYNITVMVSPNADASEVGRQTVKAIKEYERSTGRTYLATAPVG